MQPKLALIYLMGILLASGGQASPFEGVNAAQIGQDCTIKLAGISRRSFREQTINFDLTEKRSPLNMKVIIHSQKPGFTEFKSQSILEVRSFGKWLNRYLVDGEVVDLDLNYASDDEFDSTVRIMMVVKKGDVYSVQTIKKVDEAPSSPTLLMTTQEPLDFIQLPKAKAEISNIVALGQVSSQEYYLFNLKTERVQKIPMKKLKSGDIQRFGRTSYFAGHFDTDNEYVIQIALSARQTPLAFRIPKN